MNPDLEQLKIQISKINVQHQTHKLYITKNQRDIDIPIVIDLLENDQIWTKTPLKFN